MVGSLYVSNPDMWDEFYKQLNTGKIEIPKYKRRQKGNGIGGMYQRRRYMIPANVNEKDTGKQVTRVAAALERAKSQMRTAIKENRPHVPVSDNTGISIQAPVLNESTYKFKPRYATKRKRPNYDNFLVTMTDGAPPGIRASKKKRSF